jgi:uroporphyrinogen-III synthase
VACIGPVTAATARELGLEVQVEASPHTIPGLVEALKAHYAGAIKKEGANVG